MDPFRDIHAIVTGGSSGIGLATVRRLVARGARVSVIALDDPDLAALPRRPTDRAPRSTWRPPMCQSGRKPKAAVAACVAALGPCDLLVTAAGVIRPGYFEDLPDEEFERQMAVDYFGTLYCIRVVVPAMLTRRRGTIVAVSSSGGLIPVFGYSAYGPPKYAVRGLTDILRIELRPHGIHVACVYPSDVETPLLAGEMPHRPEELRRIAGTIKPIPPEQVADAILHGVARHRPVIYPDPKTRWLARLAGAAPGLTRFYMNQSTRPGPAITCQDPA